jgi:hypothetical protein
VSFERAALSIRRHSSQNRHTELQNRRTGWAWSRRAYPGCLCSSRSGTRLNPPPARFRGPAVIASNLGNQRLSDFAGEPKAERIHTIGRLSNTRINGHREPAQRFLSIDIHRSDSTHTGSRTTGSQDHPAPRRRLESATYLRLLKALGTECPYHRPPLA